METATAVKYVREFLRLYWATEHRVEAWSRELETSHGLTAKQYALMRAVQLSREITTRDLTEMLGKAQPAITQMLNRLERNGFITREVNTSDKRKREIRLTDKADDVISQIEPIGPTRVAVELEDADEREAGKVVKAMELLHLWMTGRNLSN
jgi:DNA-binding MarR family transcriptional regulator